jgi:hypothetical protein
MKKQRMTLLAGIAALALIAGAGAAAAQQTGTDEHGAKQPGAASHEMNKSGGAIGQNNAAPNGTGTKMGQKAVEENKGGKMDRNAAEQERGKMDQNATGEHRTDGKMGQKTDQQDRKAMTGREEIDRGKAAQERERSGHDNAMQRDERNGQAAEHNERSGQNRAEREHVGLNGLQGNARISVQINDQQRTRIRETVIDAQGASRVAHVDFNVAVGTVIPRSGVRIVPSPETLVAIDPSWRGLSYFVYEEELVLIDPATMTIVAVINV